MDNSRFDIPALMNSYDSSTSKQRDTGNKYSGFLSYFIYLYPQPIRLPSFRAERKRALLINLSVKKFMDVPWTSHEKERL